MSLNGPALTNITKQIRMALDHNQIACGIFVDFQKAFDTVNHEILINKLHHHGIVKIVNYAAIPQGA